MAPIIKKFGPLKYYQQAQEKMEKRIDEIQENINSLDWTDEKRTQKIELYQQIGRIMEYSREVRVYIVYCQKGLLKEANLTG